MSALLKFLESRTLKFVKSLVEIASNSDRSSAVVSTVSDFEMGSRASLDFGSLHEKKTRKTKRKRI